MTYKKIFEQEERKNSLLLEVYNSLTFDEKNYYEAWVTWRTFKRTLPPWRYFGTREIMHDHIQMISQFESLYSRRDNKRKQDKAKKDREEDEKNSYQRPIFEGRQNPTQSVL